MDIRKLPVCMIVLLIIASSVCGARAERSTGFNYVVYNEKNDTQTILTPIPLAYEYAETMKAFAGETMKNPRDLYIDANDVLYVADTGNNRIIRHDLNSGATDFITEDGKGGPFRGPQSVYAHPSGAMYIADTDAGRIVHLDSRGNFVETFGKPQSELLEGAFTFNPRKAIVSDIGLFYFIQQDSLMTMDAESRFKGYIGETKVGFNLWLAVTKFFTTNEMRQEMGAQVRPSFQSMDYSKDGFIYATVTTPLGQIRKINTLGRNIYPEFPCGERVYDAKGVQILPDFCDIKVNDKGVIAVLDANLGRVYEYDQEGNSLSVFGSGKTPGSGEMRLPVALECDSSGNYYILDADRAAIIVYRPTRFIELVHDAAAAFEDGRYDEVIENADKILYRASGYSLAHYYIGKAEYMKKNYDAAKRSFERSDSRYNYSKAFEKGRLELAVNHFLYIVAAAVAIIALTVYLIVFLKKRARRIIHRITFEE